MEVKKGLEKSMYYLIPSAKEMKTTEVINSGKLSDFSKELIHTLSQQSVEELAQILKLKVEATQKELERFNKLASDEALHYPALDLFNGLMYRQIKNDFSSKERNFIKEHLFITTALYGIIPALEPIAEHRLDFMAKLKINGKSLKQMWRNQYDEFASAHQPIVSLLSSEFEEVFSPKYRKNFIQLAFMEEKEGKLKTHSTISKKARGAYISAIIENAVDSLEALKELSVADFTYSDELSDEKKLVYIKKV